MSEREQPEVDPSEQGNYEGVSGGDTTSQSGDPNYEAGRSGGEIAEDEETLTEPEGE
jgi:hypothetical protein